MIEREILDLLKAVFDLLWLRPLELLVLLVARVRLLPQILDLSSLGKFERLLDWMFYLSRRCIGDFLIEFNRSLS